MWRLTSTEEFLIEQLQWRYQPKKGQDLISSQINMQIFTILLPPPQKKNSYKQTTLISPQKVPAANNKKNNKTNKTLRQTTCRSVEVLVFLMWSEIWFLSLCLAIFAPDATSSGSLEGVEWVHGALSVIGFRNTSTKKGG